MKFHLMAAQQVYDTEIQTVRERELITRAGMNSLETRYVVADVRFADQSFLYTVIDLETKQIRTTDMVRAESQRFGIGFYHKDTDRPLMPEDTFRTFCVEAYALADRQHAQPRMPTVDGDVGGRFDATLSTKEIAARIRTYCKEKYPDYKFSITQERGLAIDVTLLSGEGEIRTPRGIERKYLTTIGLHARDAYEPFLTPEGFDMLVDITQYAKSYNRSNSDAMTDYFDEHFYFNLNVGSWDKEYAVCPNKQKPVHISPILQAVEKKLQQKSSQPISIGWKQEL